MDKSSLLLGIQALEGKELLDGRRVLLCFGSRSLLSLFRSSAIGSSVVATASGQASALALLQSQRANLLICTDGLTEGSGISLLEQAHGRFTGLLSLLIAEQEHPDQLHRAIQAGCHGICVGSRVGQGTLLQALCVVCDGGTYIDARVSEVLRQREDPAHGRHHQRLTTRELQVLEQVVNGHSNAQIGIRLHLSTDTVKSYLKTIYQKLEARDRTHAAVIALRNGLVL